LSAKPFQPATTADYHLFTAEWCDQCVHYRGSVPCSIITAAAALSLKDPGYPAQLVCEAGDVPVCTSFIDAEHSRMLLESVRQ
jgi:hypothetical protein